MTLRTVVPLATFVALLGAQASVPSDINQLAVGKSAAAMTFSPLSGGVEPLVATGKPTVVIAFASWCSGCVAELPRNLQDYAKYKDRVNFVGVDYFDAVDAGDALIKKYGIPFPVERINVQKTSPVAAGASMPQGITMELHGVTPATLPSVLPAIAKQMPADVTTKLKDIVQHCAGLSESDCLAYAKSVGVALDSSANVVTPPPSKSAPVDAGAAVTLPATWVIDANGIVVKHFEGYDSDSDPIPAALSALGID